MAERPMMTIAELDARLARIDRALAESRAMRERHAREREDERRRYLARAFARALARGARR